MGLRRIFRHLTDTPSLPQKQRWGQKPPSKPKKVRPLQHSFLEDILGMFSGTALCALGVIMLSHLGLMTGQTAGLALLISYVTDWSFGLVFFVINLPFYGFAIKQMGMRFTVKSFIAVMILSLWVEIFKSHFILHTLHPLLGVCLIGVCIGAGLVILFRHGSSLGGVGIVGLYVQNKYGFQTGWTQLIFDIGIYGLALLVLPWPLVVLSLLGAAIVNVSIGLNHRKDRYVLR